MRVIAGMFRGRPLRARVPAGTRPTSDRLRETLFNILGPRVIESVFLDAYAGTGAVGIEAISRSAGFVHFVECREEPVRAIRANLASLDLGEGFRILNTDLDRALRLFVREAVRFDLAFLDPPYEGDEFYRKDLEALGSADVLAVGAWVVVEHLRRVVMPETAGRLRQFRTRPQGSSALTFYRVEDS